MTPDSFEYNRRTGTATVILRGQPVLIRAPEAKARKMFEALASRVDADGLLHSPPCEGVPRTVRR